jgi:hypothetical protein
VRAPLRSHWIAAAGVALAATAGVVMGDGEASPDAATAPAAAPTAAPEASPRGSTPRPAQAAAVPAHLSLDRLRRQAPVAPPSVDLFAGPSWQAPAPPAPRPPPPPPPEAPPAPSAPPLPFVYIGTLAEDGQEPVYYLEHGAQVLALKAGAAIGAEYRLVGPHGGELEFHYLPLDTRQTIRIRE